MNILQENLNEILRQRDDVLTPNNVREGVEYFGKVGTMKSGSGSIVEQTPIHIHRDATEGAEINISILSGGGEFDFVQASDGWIQNSNQTKDNTTCNSTIQITSSQECDITVDITQDSENNYDYGTLNGESYLGKSGQLTQILHLNAGQNLIPITYVKDGSVSNGTDTFRIKLNIDGIEGKPAFDADVLVYQYPSEASLLRDASKPEYTLAVVYPSSESLKSKIYQRIDNKWVFVGVANDNNLTHYNIKRGVQIGDIYGSFGTAPNSYSYDMNTGDYVRSITMDVNLGDTGTIQNAEYRMAPSGRTYVKFNYFTNADIDVLVNGLSTVLTNTNGIVEAFEFDVSSVPFNLSEVFSIDYGFVNIPFNIITDEHVAKYVVPHKSDNSYILYSPKFKRLEISMALTFQDSWVQDNVRNFEINLDGGIFNIGAGCVYGNPIGVTVTSITLDYEHYMEVGMDIVFRPRVLSRIFTNFTGLPLSFENTEEGLTCNMPVPVQYHWNDYGWTSSTYGEMTTKYERIGASDNYTITDTFAIALRQNFNSHGTYNAFNYKFTDMDGYEISGHMSIGNVPMSNTVSCDANGLNINGSIAIEITDFIMSRTAETHTYAEGLPISIKGLYNESEEICTATVSARGNQFDGVNINIIVPQSAEQNGGNIYLQMIDSNGSPLQTQMLRAGSTVAFTIRGVDVSIFENIENFRWLGRRMWRITDFVDILGSDVTVENDFEAEKPLGVLLTDNYGVDFVNPILKFYRGNLSIVSNLTILNKETVQNIFMPMPQFDYYRLVFDVSLFNTQFDMTVSGLGPVFNTNVSSLSFDINTLGIFSDTLEMTVSAKYDKRDLIPVGSTGLVYYDGENRVYTYLNGFTTNMATRYRINIEEGMTLDEISLTNEAYLWVPYDDNNSNVNQTYLDMSTFEYADGYFNSNNDMLALCENPSTGEKLCYNTYTGKVIKADVTWHETEIRIYRNGNNYSTAYYALLSPTIAISSNGVSLVKDNQGYVYSPYLEEGDTFTDDNGTVITIRFVKYYCDGGLNSSTTFYFDVDFTESRPEITGTAFLDLVMYDIDGVEVGTIGGAAGLKDHKGTVNASVTSDYLNVAKFNVNVAAVE